VKRFSSRCVTLPAIAKEDGTIFREATVKAHVKNDYNKDAYKTYQLMTILPIQAAQHTPIGKLILNVNEKLANKIGCLMIQVYNDAKKLTLSANTFPCRSVFANISTSYKMNDEGLKKLATNDLQYLFPTFHWELLECIVECDRQRVRDAIVKDTLAMSIRCDGSVDRTQIDKIFVMGKAVTKSGKDEQFF